MTNSVSTRQKLFELRHHMAEFDDMQVLPVSSIKELILILTERCNLKCQGCSYWRSGTLDMSLEMGKRCITDLKAANQLANVSFTGGEPTLSTSLEPLAELAKENGCSTRLITSGVMGRKKLSSLIPLIDLWVVSVDAVSPETYRNVRGVDAYSAVIATLSSLITRSLDVRASFLMTNQNYTELPRFLSYCKEIGVTSARVLLPDVRGMFGPEYFLASTSQHLMLTEDEIARLEAEVIPPVTEFVRQHVGYTNLTSSTIEMILRYIRTSAFDGGKLRNRHLLRSRKCSVPFNTVVAFPDGKVGLCYYFNRRFQLTGRIDANNQQLMRDRGAYFFEGKMFQEHCVDCMQAWEGE